MRWLRRSGRAKEKLQGVLATSKKDIYPEYFPQQLSFLISFSINHPQNTYNASNTPYKTSTTFIMQFSAVTFIAFVVTGVVALTDADGSEPSASTYCPAKASFCAYWTVWTDWTAVLGVC